MSLVQQSPVRSVTLRRPFALFHSRPWQPALNVYETEQAISIVADLAGADPASLDIDVHPTHVDIRGMRQLNAPAELRRILRMEIAAGAFQIEVPLSVSIDPEQTEARYTNGLLEIWLPFAQQAVQQKEKLLAAQRVGVRTVILPRENEPDLRDVPDETRAQLEIVLVEHMDEVLPHVLHPQEAEVSV